MSGNPPGPSNSLLQYHTAILVSTTGKAGSKKQALPAAREKGGHQKKTAEFLNSILPPREFTEAGQLWVQYVSATPATKADVINLQEELDKRLMQKQARETGICPIREELYSQCFDELIRQIAIECLERGFLLVRVRDEIRMTIEAYQALYESSIAYGMRKALKAEQKKAEMNKSIETLRSTCTEMQKQVEKLEKEILDIERQEAEDKEKAEKKHDEDVKLWKDSIHELKEELQNQLSAPKKS